MALLTCDTERWIAGVLVALDEAVPRDDNTVVGAVVLADTVFLMADRFVIERVGCLFVVVIVLVFPRVTVFASRTAAAALNMQTTEDKTKNRIFFISVCNSIKNMIFRASKIT